MNLVDLEKSICRIMVYAVKMNMNNIIFLFVEVGQIGNVVLVRYLDTAIENTQ